MERLITGLALGFLTIFAVFLFSHLWFMLLTTLIMTLAAIECCALAGYRQQWQKVAYVIALWLLLWLSNQALVPACYIGVLVLLSALLFLALPIAKTTWWCQSWRILIIGLCLTVPSWAAANLMHVESRALLFYLILLVTFSDTGAYYIGSKFGKRKLAPTLSPKKSWEGFAGGLVIGLLVANIYRVFVVKQALPIWGWILFGTVIIIFGLFGDLFESLLKRQSGAKDSGSLLPGHGGFLDRLDSLMLTLPIFVIICLMLKLI